MLIPCIDLQDGKAVQLVRGRRLALSVDDVVGLLDRFRDFPILHVIDLDAAIGWAEKCPGAQWGVVEVRPTATAFIDGAWTR